jgi:hypothetical protein
MSGGAVRRLLRTTSMRVAQPRPRFCSSSGAAVRFGSARQALAQGGQARSDPAVGEEQGGLPRGEAPARVTRRLWSAGPGLLCPAPARHRERNEHRLTTAAYGPRIKNVRCAYGV